MLGFLIFLVLIHVLIYKYLSDKSKKDTRIAFVLAAAFPGLGHTYCRDIKRAIAFPVGDLIAFGLSASLASNLSPDGFNFATVLLFILPPILVHVWSIYDAYQLAKEKNREIEIVKTQKEEKEKLKITSSEFAEKIIKVNRLYENEIFTEEEFQREKKSIIKNLNNRIIVEEPDDFLASLVPLKRQGSLEKKDIDIIKAIV